MRILTLLTGLRVRSVPGRRHLSMAIARSETADILKAFSLEGGGQALIGGAWTATGGVFEVLDPATNARICDVADCGVAETAAAIAAASRAQPSWAALPARKRADALKAWHARIVANADALAALVTLECGKPRAEARGEVGYGAGFVEWFAEEAPRVAGECKSNFGGGKRCLTVRAPVGVTAAITPWNFPLAMITRKVAPALAAGCVSIVKPSEDSPLTALALAKLAEGLFPPGVLSVLPASRSNAEPIGAALCDSPKVRALSFTGSTAVGKWLYARCAPTVKKLGLELGGNAPFIVLAGADVEVAADAAMASKFRNAGQTCVCADRFLVHRSVEVDFLAALGKRVALLDVGHGLDAGTTIGPLINAAAAARVRERVGASGGTHAGSLGSLGGGFLAPLVVSNVDVTSALWVEETFGPIVPVATFTSVDDAVALANEGAAGLAAYVCGDLAAAWAVAERLDYGIVGVNDGAPSNVAMPFGGVKESGLGREGGNRGMDEYLEDKYLSIGGVSC